MIDKKPKGYKYSREEMIQILQELAEKLGKTPTISVTRKEISGFVDQVKKELGWNNALQEAGLELNHTSKRIYSREEMIQILQELAEKLGKTPTIEDARKEISGFVDQVTKEFGWNNALQEAGLKLNNSSTRIYSREEMICILQELAEKLGKTPTAGNTKKEISSGFVDQAIKEFGKWNNALQEIGFDVTSKQSWNDDKIVSELQRLSPDGIHMPSHSQMKSCRGLYCIIQRRGGFLKYSKMAGLIYLKNGTHRVFQVTVPHDPTKDKLQNSDLDYIIDHFEDYMPQELLDKHQEWW